MRLQLLAVTGSLAAALQAGSVHAASTAATATTTTALAAQTAQPDVSVTAAAGSSAYANMPTTWPDPNQTKGPINLPALLGSPLVLAGLARVAAVVPAALLATPVTATQPVLGSGTVIYTADATAAGLCWGQNQCYRTVAANGYQPDVTACPAANAWGLTFDDGPTDVTDTPGYPATADLVTALKAAKTNATFFVVGSQSYYHPTDLQATYAAGHEIAVHTWNHAALTTLTNEQIVAEVLYTEALIVKILGVRPRLFRPPFGDVDDRRYTNIMWGPNYDSGDSHGDTLATVLANVAAWIKAGPGFIGLDHNIDGPTTEMSVDVVNMITYAKGNGTFPLTVSAVGECLGLNPYIAITGTTTASAIVASATTTSAAASTASAATSAAGSAVGSKTTSAKSAATTAADTIVNSGAQEVVAGALGAAGVAAVLAGIL
ncbi:chitin deacetylase [Thoreauomyces humboldtii]|nr:chitin deacetylase [Thoreauomyces humboldtii]